MIIQAGQSGRGRQFAGKWAGSHLHRQPQPGHRAGTLRRPEATIAAEGRDPNSVRIPPMVYVITGETESIAREKEAIFLNELVHPQASLALLSEVTNYDFSGHSLDDEITDELVDSISGIRGLVQGVKRHLGDQKMTLRVLANHRATLLQGAAFRGYWRADRRPDGRLVQLPVPATDSSSPQHISRAHSDFTRLVVPVLQGPRADAYRLHRQHLRENLGAWNVPPTSSPRRRRDPGRGESVPEVVGV